jgi:hypothetical protein
MLPIQIIEVGELSDEENLWLYNLSLNMPEENAQWVSGVDRKYGELIDVGVYVSAVMSANQDTFKKEDILMLTARTRKILEEIGWAEQWMEKGKLEDARAMFAEGDSIEKIARITKLPLETLKENLAVQ